MVRWVDAWRLRRSEKALERARRVREALDREDPDYGGVRLEQVETERRLERRIADLKTKLRN